MGASARRLHMRLIPRDKALHALAGLAAACAGLFLAGGGGAAALAALAAGIGKEWSDARNPVRHRVDGWDALWTAAPGALVAVGVDLARVLGYALPSIVGSFALP